MIEIDENIVSAEIAKLLKLLGYNRECNHAYVLDKNGYVLYGPTAGNVRKECVALKYYEVLIAPTVDKAVEYIIDDLRMYPAMTPLRYGSWCCSIYDMNKNCEVIHEYVNEDFNKTLSYGIEYCCKHKLESDGRSEN